MSYQVIETHKTEFLQNKYRKNRFFTITGTTSLTRPASEYEGMPQFYDPHPDNKGKDGQIKFGDAFLTSYFVSRGFRKRIKVTAEYSVFPWSWKGIKLNARP